MYNAIFVSFHMYMYFRTLIGIWVLQKQICFFIISEK